MVKPPMGTETVVHKGHDRQRRRGSVHDNEGKGRSRAAWDCPVKLPLLSSEQFCPRQPA
jgi:hypothetical protein